MTARSLAVALVGALACHEDPTALVIEVRPGAMALDLDEVVFHVAGSGLEAAGRDARAPISGPTARPFPLTLVLLRDAGAPGPFHVSIDGLKAGTRSAVGVATPSSDDDAPIAFEPGRVVRRAYELQAVAAAVAPAPGTMPADPTSMPPPPAPCMQVRACMAGCSCPAGCACAWDCTGKDCAGTCSGAGTSCTMTCPGKSHCKLSCRAGATCMLRCLDDADCQLADCSPVTCPDGTRVCNRACP